MLKPFEMFNKNKHGLFGLRGRCKECDRIYQAEWYQKNREKVKVVGAEYRKANVEKLRLRGRIYAKRNVAQKRAYRAQWQKENPEKVKTYQDRHRPKKHVRRKEKFNSNPATHINFCVSTSMRKSLKGKKSGRHWEGLVGYGLSALMAHLEKGFQPGMAWENYGKNGWHIDHIIPLSVFNFTDPSHFDFKRCWSLNNLRPLWGKENISKSDRIDKPFQPSLLMP